MADERRDRQRTHIQRNAKIIVANPATFVGLGKASDPQVLLAAAGLILIAILMARRVGSAILIAVLSA